MTIYQILRKKKKRKVYIFSSCEKYLDLFNFLLRESIDADLEEEDVEDDLRLLLFLEGEDNQGYLAPHPGQLTPTPENLTELKNRVFLLFFFFFFLKSL